MSAGLKRMAMVTADHGLGKAIIEDVAKEIDNHGLSCESSTRSLRPPSGRRAAWAARAP
jgi:hypothetical protein